MPSNVQNFAASEPALPSHWATEVEPMLADGEKTQAWLELDLDQRLQFASGVVIVTDRRLLARAPDETDWREWPLRRGLNMDNHDHAGVGMIEVLDEQGRLACWRYTLGRNLAALRLIGEFALHRDSVATGQPVLRSTEDICPKCKAPLPPGEDECPICNREATVAPSTWTLFRLWRFARPYRWQLLSGFLLTLAATAATLVPPYLTMPLMDNVLIPFQNGKPIDWPLVSLYLSGLLGSALLAWLLGWIRTYILALMSERIGRDLRTTTYEHLLGLSLEYFGGKRTGDLMARIGSETDRINVFLSLDLLNFATDVLMIAMTAVILFSINPWLALVTLLPLPIIGWMIHFVREKLRTGFEKIDRVWAEVTNVLADTIPGIRVVKAFAQEKREAERFRAANEHNLVMNDKLNKTWSLFSPTVTLLTEIGLLVVWAFGIWQISKNEITVGVLTAFLAYIGRFYTRLDSMSRIVSATQRAASSTKRIFDILDHVSSVPEPANPVHLTKVTGHIELKKASFRYGTRAVTRDVDLVIKPGEMIGLVGHSGSGKIDAGQPDLPLLRRHRRRGIHRWRQRSFGTGRRVPPAHRPGVAGALPVLRHHCREHRLRQAACIARRDHCRRPRRPCPRVHPAPGTRLRLTGRRARPGPVRRRAPAHLDCPRAVDRPEDSHPRRSDVLGRHRNREGNPEGARQSGARSYHHRHRPPPVHAAQGRPAGRHGSRPDRRSRQPRCPDGRRRPLLQVVSGTGAQCRYRAGSPRAS